MTEEEATPADITRLLQASRLVTRQFGLESGQRAVLVNGRVRYPLAAVWGGPHSQFHETACRPL